MVASSAVSPYDHPEIALGRAEGHGVPVDEQTALTGPHHVAGVRLSVRDHPRVAAPCQISSETIGQREQFGHVGRVIARALAVPVPRTAHRPRSGSPPGVRLRASGDRADRGRTCLPPRQRLVSLGEARRAASRRRLVRPARSWPNTPASPATNGKRAIVWRGPIRRTVSPPLVGDRRDHELEAAVAECDSGVERTSETVERRLTCVSEPVLPVQVVDGHEGARSLAVAHHPVVAAPADGRVLGRVDVEAPVIGESTDQRTRVDALRQRSHATKSKPLARWVGRTRREIPSEPSPSLSR